MTPRTYPPRTATLALALSALAVVSLVGCNSGSGGGTIACAGFTSPAKGTGQTFTIAGVVAYEDRVQDDSGFTAATQPLPVRGAKVQVVRCSDGAVLSSDALNDAGGFSVDVSNSDDVGLYVRVLTQIDDPGYAITVKDTHGALYAMEGDAFDERLAPPQDLIATVATNAGPPFNILDNALEAVRFVEDNLGLAGGLKSLTLLWEANKTDFTAYLPASRTIHILDQPNAASPDTDGYDDMVIRHEVGHFIADQISKDDSPGGAHFLGETDQDARLAWSEGWANFFGGAVADNPDYVDTFDPTPGGGALTFSIEDLGGFSGTSTSELAVAAALWDGLDGPGGGATDADGDGSDLGPVPILTALADLEGNPDPVEFGAFWNALRSDPGNAPADLEAFRTAALSPNGIDLFEDDGTDDDPATGTVVASLPADIAANLAWDVTAPATSDVDHYRVTLTSGTLYTIRTTSLTDGADTMIQVLDAAGDPLAPAVLNDNFLGSTVFYTTCSAPSTCPANGPPYLLSSRVFFTPSATQTYVVQVARSPLPPPSAGLFGGYSLQITP